MLTYCSKCAPRPWFGAKLVPMFAPLVIIFATAAMPLPKDGPCPPGYSSSASYCVPSNDAKPASPKVGQCPSGYKSSGRYCTRSDRTVTAAGIAALDKGTGSIALTVSASATNGYGGGAGIATINYAPQSTSVGAIPLTFNDPLFANMVEKTSGDIQVPSGTTLSNTSVKEQTANTATFLMNDGSTLDHCRCISREGVRLGAGTQTIKSCYLEAQGKSGDHADVIQAYAPGAKGSLIVRNTTLRAYNHDATAGIFVADNWTGTIDLQDVVFIGGPYGLRVHPDVGGDNYVYLKNVYFVGPFQFGPFLLTDVGGHVNRIRLWDNVRNATIVNGMLVPGSLIAPPKPVGQ
jgi:hypothetical protein